MANDEHIGIVPEEWGIDSEAIKREAAANLKKCKPYQKLYDELNRLDPRRDYVKHQYVMTKIRLMESKEIDRLVNLQIDRRKDVNRLADYLQGEERERYQELMAGLSLLMDMMDSTFTDINKVLKRNKTGVEMGNFPEILAARKLVWQMTNNEQNDMAQYKNDLWAEESERLYKYLRERCAMFRKKVEKIEAKLNKQ